MDGVETLLFEDLVTPFFSGNLAYAVFEISELLISQLQTTFLINPATGFHPKVNQGEMLKPYRIAYYEQFGQPAAIDVLKNSRWFYALNGGVPPHLHAEMFMNYDNLHSYFNKTNNFGLTWHNFDKITNVNALEIMYFAIPRDPETSNFVLRVTRHYLDDGDEFVDFNIGHKLQLGQAFMLDVSYRAIIESHTEGFSGYTVQLLSVDESFYSNQYNYIMDFRSLPYVRHFLFKNSLGAFETVRFTGELAKELTFDRQFYEQTSLQYFSETASSRGQLLPQVARSFRISTGWVSKQEIEWLQDFLSSPEVYELIDLKTHAVLIVQDKLELVKDSNQLNSLTIEMQYVDLPTVFQRDIAIPWAEIIEITPPYQED